jgi:hypoxanthine phosphoribosyltransferase
MLEEIARLNSVLEKADCLYTAEQVQATIDRMAISISADYRDKLPLLLCVMNGGLFLMAAMLRRLQFPMECDYLHASRYRGATTGNQSIDWLAKPKTPLAGRHVLIIDDILDEGFTLKEIVSYCRGENVASVETCVLTQKIHDRPVADIAAKYTGLELPDRYVFGCGMDYKHYFRNLNAIYALAGS